MKVFLLALSLPFVWWGVPNAFAQSESLSRITGRLEIIQVDNFDNPIEEKIYLLEDSVSHQTFELYFAGEPPANLSTGSTISVQGWVEGSAIYLEAVSFSSVPLSKDASGIEVLDVQVAPEATSSNVRRAVVLIADFIDSPSDCTSESQAADAMFTGVQSVDGMYRESSFGVVSFPGDTNANGQPDVYRVSIPASVADACAPTPWATQADAAAVSMGVDLSLYQHKVYALPQNVTCSWAGLANVGCAGTCRAWTRICYSDIFAHELGHNLGMAHASTDVNNDGIVDSEYGDTSDIMGYGGIGWRQFNGPHKEQMGWLPPSQITEITGGGTRIVTLSPLEIDAASAPYSQLVKIPKAGTNEYYYVSYRRRIGYDAALSLSYADRANVHHSHPPDSRTFFIQALSDTGTFQDLISGITVTQLSHDANGVTVQIDAVVINDTTPPTVSMTSPANGATVTGAINVSATASDNVGVVGVQFTRNGVYIGAEDTTPPYSISWNTLSEADGSHSLSAVARDAAGNTTTASPVVVTVSNNTDTSPPVISNVGAGGVTQTAATITWTTNEASDSQVDYGTTASYGSSTSLNTSLATSHSTALAGLSAGTLYHYRVRSKDAAGNLGLSADYTFTTTAPTNQPPTVYAGPDQTIVLPAVASLSGTTSDDGLPNPPARLTYAWTGPAGVTFGSPTALSTTAGFSSAGTYVLRLTVSDGPASSMDELSINVREPGNRLPQVNVTADIFLGTAPLSVTFSATASDPDGDPLRLTWDFGDETRLSGAGADPVAHVFDAVGLYYVSVTADDGRGGVVRSDALAVEVIDNAAIDNAFTSEGPHVVSSSAGCHTNQTARFADILALALLFIRCAANKRKPKPTLPQRWQDKFR